MAAEVAATEDGPVLKAFPVELAVNVDTDLTLSAALDFTQAMVNASRALLDVTR